MYYSYDKLTPLKKIWSISAKNKPHLQRVKSCNQHDDVQKDSMSNALGV